MREKLEDFLKRIQAIFPDNEIRKVWEHRHTSQLLSSISSLSIIIGYVYRVSSDVTFAVSTVNGNAIHSTFFIGKAKSKEGKIVLNDTSSDFYDNLEMILADSVRAYRIIQRCM